MTAKQLYTTQANALGLGDLTRVKTGKPRTALINQISDMYCDATDKGDEIVRAKTISALMVLFWGEIGKMQDKCRAVADYEYDDFVQQLYLCINTAMQYRAWKDGKHNAEQCIRAAISSRGAAAILYESNLDKNKANINKTELDRPVGDDDTTILDTLADEDERIDSSTANIEQSIQNIINKGDLIGAVVLDNIAFNDSTKEVKETKVGIDEEGNEYKYTTGHAEFHEYRLVQTLATLDEDYVKYFMNRYTIQEAAIQAAYNRIKSVNNSKLYSFVRDTIKKQRVILAD